MGFGKMTSWDFVKMLHSLNYMWMRACNKLLTSADLLQQISNNKFDLMLAHYIDLCPLQVAFLTGITNTAWISPATYIIDEPANYLAVPTVSSFIPNGISTFSDRMSFFQRVTNFVLVNGISLLDKTSVNSLFIQQDKLFRELLLASFDNDKTKNHPNMWQLISNVSGLFMNGEPFLDFPRPLFWSCSFLGTTGAVRTNRNSGRKLLSDQWEELIENYTGVIVFSFGSIVETKLMPDEMVDAFLNAFAKFPQLKVVWRFEKEVPKDKFPKNIHTSPWIPQEQLLNHKKAKLFITHGGYNSLLEAARAGVPMLIIPLWGDQYINAVRAVRYNLGLVLKKHGLSDGLIVDSINKLLNDKTYSQHCLKLATFMDDKIQEPGQVLSQRLNFLVKAKWKPNQTAAQRLNFVQYYLIDVILFIVFVVALGFLALCAVIWQLYLMITDVTYKRRKK